MDFSFKILKFLIFVIIYIVLTNIEAYFPKEMGIRSIISIIGIIISIYFGQHWYACGMIADGLLFKPWVVILL